MAFTRLPAVALTALALTALPTLSSAQVSFTDSTYSNGEFGYSFTYPQNWKDVGYDHSNYKGSGAFRSDIVLPTSDLFSRQTRYFEMTAGTRASVFGLNPKVVAQLSDEELADYQIDRLRQGLIDFTILDTKRQTLHGLTVYVVRSQHVVPGPFTMERTDYLAFKGSNAYLWYTDYFTTFSADAATLARIANSVDIR